MAYMQGIDIASYQKGINLATVISKNSLGFVVVKATEGSSYTNPYFADWAEDVLDADACLGIYHYISGTGYKSEMKHFIDKAGDYVGKAVFALDWESGSNDAWGTVSYLENCVDYFIGQTGIKPLIYVSKSYESQISDIADAYDCGEWIAQYANNNSTGLQSSPWNEGNYSCAMRQYSSHGSLTGYSGNLDLDKFYGNASAWEKYATANGTVSSSASASSSVSSTLDLGSDLGTWGKKFSKALQTQLGTTVDGIISSQPSTNKKYNTATSGTFSWVSSGSGSKCIKALQKKLINAGYSCGSDGADGKYGKNSIKAHQRWLNKKGYGSLDVDGYHGTKTNKAMAKALKAYAY